MPGRARFRITTGAGVAVAGAIVVAVGAAGLVPSARAAPASAAGPAGHAAFAAFRDGPPARVTGGFGEDSCYACHWEGKENDGVGSLKVLGFPATFEPGASHRLRVELARPRMRAAGFQLAIRHASDTTQAGDLTVAPGEGGRTGVLTDRDIRFAHHLLPGSDPEGAGSASWEIDWTAPQEGGRVLLHVSAVAGNADESQMGDHVYTLELESEPASPARFWTSVVGRVLPRAGRRVRDQLPPRPLAPWRYRPRLRPCCPLPAVT